MKDFNAVLQYTPLYLDILKWVGIAALSCASFPFNDSMTDNGFVKAAKVVMWLMGMVFFIQILIYGKVLVV
jgi:hypothetical protein